MQSIISKIQLGSKHLLSRALHSYADYRIGATQAEKQCHKTSNSVLLTFDDYGSEQEVNEVLQILKDKQVRGMFFLQGDWAEAHPELVSLIAKAGHILGNHTYSHKVLRGASREVIEAEIKGGLPGPWLRPPQGRYDKYVRRIAADLGYSICYWTIDSRDWTGVSAEEMRHTVLSELHPGAVVLFHLHGAHTRELLPSLIDDIRSRGLELTPMNESWEAPQR